MQSLEIISDPDRPSADLVEILSEYFAVRQFGIGMIRSKSPGHATVFDITVRDSVRVAMLKSWLTRRPPHAKTLIVLNTKDFAEFTRARSIGVDRVVVRPFQKSHLLNCLFGTLAPADRARRGSATLQAAVSQGVEALGSMFAAVRSGQPLDADTVSDASKEIVQEIGRSGLSNWVETVRKHHDGTYQHCLLVTGVAAAFARHLEFSAEDQARISFAAMIHDVGKAKVPLAILDKPGALDEDEWRIMRAHPKYGVEVLANQPDIPDAVLDMVLHHHEYLDGSGYPDGLRGEQISDVARMVTISDIFGALLERRSYKPPMSGRAAYQILLNIGEKLDRDMVREFAAVATLAAN